MSFTSDSSASTRWKSLHVLAARGGRWYQRDDATLHLGVENPFLAAKKAHPALVVDSYDELMGRLEQAGVEVRSDLSIPGVRRCHVTIRSVTE